MTESAAQQGLPKAYTPRDVEGAIYERWLAADVFAPDGAGSTATRAAALHDHPAAAERHRLPAPGPRPADRGGGPDDPPRPDARSRGAFPARPGPRSIAAQFVLDGILAKEGRAGRRSVVTAISSACALRRRDARGHARAAAPRRRVRRLGPSALHDGRRLGQGRPDRVRAALSRGSRLSHRGARQLVPGLPHERQRPRGHPDARDRHALVRALPPARRGDGRAGSGGDDHRRHHPPGDDPRRHGRRRPPGRPALRGPGRAVRAHPIRRSRRADHRGRRRGPGIRDRAP